MGLDMYAYTTRENVTQEVDFDVDEDNIDLLHRWRKHSNLHGAMQALYMLKGGTNAYFNCSNLRLSLDDLRTIEGVILRNALPDTAGVFFGNSDGTEKADDLLFIEKARNAIAAGLSVFYRAWW